MNPFVVHSRPPLIGFHALVAFAFFVLQAVTSTAVPVATLSKKIPMPEPSFLSQFGIESTIEGHRCAAMGDGKVYLWRIQNANE